MKKNNPNSGLYIKLIVASVLFMPLFSSLIVKGGVNDTIPQKWVDQWQNPSADLRPLQIVHDMDLRNPKELNLKGKRNYVTYLRDSCGLGGVVCNVERGEKYLKSEEAWKKFVDGVRFLRENNMRVWIYDEDGYPSLSAGGRVLEGHPELESLEMVYDKNHVPVFYSRPSYEFTHASNNFAAARRYPNPLNKRATERFIEVTHNAYLEHLGKKSYSEVEAFFTDEPSLMAVSLGQLEENVRKNVKVQDPIDITKKPLPAIPWVEDLNEKYKQKYNEDLMPRLLSLFEGNSKVDKEIRQKFWSLIGEVDKTYYYDAIQNWCKNVRLESQGKGPLSSGHGLREESILMHVPLDGNKIQALSGLDIPGLDFLDSDPKAWMRNNGSFAGNWQATALPVSVAQLTGKRRVMCEMSDFVQTMAGKEPVRLEEMQASTSWQMAWGVTDFNLYYKISYRNKFQHRNESTYKAYCDFVGRINAIVLDAKPVKSALLYYPIYDMQREYQPTATPVSINTQNEKVRQVEASYHQTGLSLAMAQVPFILIDNLILGKATITGHATISVGGNEYTSLIIPQGSSFPPEVEMLIGKMKDRGIKVITTGQKNSNPTEEELLKELNPAERIIPVNGELAFGKFSREGHDIYLLVNSGSVAYTGQLTVLQKGKWNILDPQTGKIAQTHSSSLNGKNSIPVSLASNQTMIYVSD